LGPDGDFTEGDLTVLSRGAMRVSLKLLPYNAVLRVHPSADGTASAVVDEAKFVRFKHLPPSGKDPTYSTLSCLHEFEVLPSFKGINNPNSKRKKNMRTQIYQVPISSSAPGGANISVLRSHSVKHFQSTAARKNHPVQPGQPSMLSFLSQAITKSNNVSDALINDVTTTTTSFASSSTTTGTVARAASTGRVSITALSNKKKY